MSWFDDETTFVPVSPSQQFRRLWERYEWSCKHQGRFFSSDLKGMLDELFKDMRSFLDPAQDGLFEDMRSKGQSPFFSIIPGGELSVLYRARLAKTRDEALAFAKAPAIQIGSPPSVDAIPGRMNAGGISVFYGALSEKTCVAELRPRVGGLAVLGRFRVIRDLRLLDFTKFNEHFLNESVFSANHDLRESKLAFLQEIGEIIGKPIQPHEELLDYVPTQVLAEYLRQEHDLDGLIYPSAQHASNQDSADLDDSTRRSNSNIVLFHHAARVVEGHVIPDPSIDADVRQPSLELDVRRDESWNKPVEIVRITSVVVEHVSAHLDWDLDVDNDDLFEQFLR